MPSILASVTLHETAVIAAAKPPPVKPDPTVWAAALKLAHGDASVLHVESRTVVWVGKPIVRTVRAPRKRGARK